MPGPRVQGFGLVPGHGMRQCSLSVWLHVCFAALAMMDYSAPKRIPVQVPDHSHQALTDAHNI